MNQPPPPVTPSLPGRWAVGGELEHTARPPAPATCTHWTIVTVSHTVSMPQCLLCWIVYLTLNGTIIYKTTIVLHWRRLVIIDLRPKRLGDILSRTSLGTEVFLRPEQWSRPFVGHCTEYRCLGEFTTDVCCNLTPDLKAFFFFFYWPLIEATSL